jgi:hypothetical protein
LVFTCFSGLKSKVSVRYFVILVPFDMMKAFFNWEIMKRPYYFVDNVLIGFEGGVRI